MMVRFSQEIPMRRTEIQSLSTREKASLLTIAVSIAFTVLKFVVYFFSGSIAVLSEAWHSFGDVFTSVLVFLSFRHDRRRSESQQLAPEPDEGKSGGGFLDRMSTEMKVSLLIGCILVVIAIGILYKAATSRPTTIEQPVPSGIIFIIFSIGSYFLYRFSTNVGTAEGSAALISDGMHSKADMYNSLLTGFSLILYAFGVNLDRIVGGMLAFFLLSYAIEMFANVAAMHRQGSSQYQRLYSCAGLIVKGMGFFTLRNVFSVIDRSTGLDLRNSHLCRVLERWRAALIGVPLLVLLATTAVVVVPIDEIAVIERFGEPLAREEMLGPGLHLTCPWPVDRIQRVKTTAIRELRLGNVSYESGFALIWTRQHGQEEKPSFKLVKTRFLPSGDQLGLSPPSVEFVSCIKLVPSVSIIHILRRSVGPDRFATKAILDPSGENSGSFTLRSCASPLRIILLPLPLASVIIIPSIPSSVHP
jgi:hypothetical protein